MITNQIGTVVLGIALLLSLRDIYGHSRGEYDDDEVFEKEFGDEEIDEKLEDTDYIPVRQGSAHFTAPPHTIKKLPSMKFLFCVSCGYRQAFDEFSRYIHEKYPSMRIDGANYSPNAWKNVMAQVIGLGKIVLIVLIVMGQDPFASIGQPTPRIFTWALNNKVSSCMMLFLLSNTIESSLMSTGAFEIYLGDEQIWSKLESGRVPSPSELVQIIDQQMELQGAKVSDTFAFDSS
uniref:SelT-like protein n=1 Tax=Setaria digitata TaxID=48799 RepID=A0A915Q792_9BILA